MYCKVGDRVVRQGQNLYKLLASITTSQSFQHIRKRRKCAALGGLCKLPTVTIVPICLGLRAKLAVPQGCRVSHYDRGLYECTD